MLHSDAKEVKGKEADAGKNAEAVSNIRFVSDDGPTCAQAPKDDRRNSGCSRTSILEGGNERKGRDNRSR